MALEHAKRKLNIALVSDFFYPRTGGVEMHQYYLAQCLIARGHKVIAITGTFGGKRQGVRYMTNGFRVYYCPQLPLVDQVVAPTLFSMFPLMRDIFIREEIDIVHAHQATSTMGHEAILHARTMGLRVIYTDHSLFGFASAPAIHLNKLMKFSLSDASHIVAVSHTDKENLVLRAYLDPEDVSVVPNSVDLDKFLPDPSRAPSDLNERLNIVLVSRLVYRKGVDLVVEVIPEICRRFPHVHFIIGGDGPKRLQLEEMRERHQLHDRVEMLGAIPHVKVRDVLCRGHVFLNCSLTESFCIAILEAACCGLYVVSTRVGGVSEVMPRHMVSLADPDPQSLIEAVAAAIPKARHVKPLELHRQLRTMYSWHNVASRTERVYRRAMAQAPRPFMDRLKRLSSCGDVAGKLFCLVAVVDLLFLFLLEWLRPAELTDKAPSFPRFSDNVVMHSDDHGDTDVGDGFAFEAEGAATGSTASKQCSRTRLDGDATAVDHTDLADAEDSVSTGVPEQQQLRRSDSDSSYRESSDTDSHGSSGSGLSSTHEHDVAVVEPTSVMLRTRQLTVDTSHHFFDSSTSSTLRRRRRRFPLSPGSANANHMSRPTSLPARGSRHRDIARVVRTVSPSASPSPLLHDPDDLFAVAQTGHFQRPTLSPPTLGRSHSSIHHARRKRGHVRILSASLPSTVHELLDQTHSEADEAASDLDRLVQAMSCPGRQHVRTTSASAASTGHDQSAPSG